MMNLFKEEWFIRLFGSVLTILISLIIYKTISFIIFKGTAGKRVSKSKKINTYTRLVRNILRYVIILIDVLIILQIHGINVTSMVAGVGVISIILGFAIQDALKDIIKGFDIISDSYYQVGDVIKYEDIIGKVLSIGLKTTKLEDVNTFNIVSISNRKIEQVEVVSNLINIDVPLSYDLEVKSAINVIDKIVNEIKKHNDVDNCEYRGINDLADSSIKYQIKVYCNPVKKVQVRRDALGIIMTILEKEGIKVPYNQIDVHQR